MYTVNKGPSKLVAKARSGLSQNYEKIESIRKCATEQFGNGISGCNKNIRENDISVAKPVFQQYRRSHSNRAHNQIDSRMGYHQEQQPPPSPQYEELIKYIRDSWNIVSAQNAYSEQESADTSESSLSTISASAPSSPTMSDASSSSSYYYSKRVVYHNDPPNPILKDFGPFDLESWWGRRLFNNITKSL